MSSSRIQNVWRKHFELDRLELKIGRILPSLLFSSSSMAPWASDKVRSKKSTSATLVKASSLIHLTFPKIKLNLRIFHDNTTEIFYLAAR